jgi:hypothetical protein
LDSSDFSQLCILDFIQKLQKKKSVSNGNELKKCIKQVNDGRYISTTQRYIGLKSDQLSQAVELVSPCPRSVIALDALGVLPKRWRVKLTG